MSQKFHINKHGVPAPCKATKGNCPYGGDSGDENHFDTLNEAQEYAHYINERESSILPTQDASEVNVDVSQESWDSALGHHNSGEHWGTDGMAMAIHSDQLKESEDTKGVYDSLPDDLKKEAESGDGFSLISRANSRDYIATNILSDTDNYGREDVQDYFKSELAPSLNKHFPGSIETNGDEVDVRDSETISKIAEFADSKLAEENNLSINGKDVFVEGNSDTAREYSGQITKRNWVDEYAESEKEMNRKSKYLTGLIDKRTANADEGIDASITSSSDIDYAIEVNDALITSQEHDPIKNSGEMFDHMRNKKIYRYDAEGESPLEGYTDNFDRNIGHHRELLENDGYFSELEDEWDEDPREVFEQDARNHRKVRDFTQEISTEYARDFEKKVDNNPEYSLNEKDRLAEKYKENLKARIKKHVF